MHSPWRLPIQHLSNLAWIHGYSLKRYHVTQKLNFGQPELALAEFCIQLIITQSLKHSVEMLFMLFLTLRKNKLSSMKTMTNLSSSSMKTVFIKYMK
jgi:hypothetical protein